MNSNTSTSQALTLALAFAVFIALLLPASSRTVHAQDPGLGGRPIDGVPVALEELVSHAMEHAPEVLHANAALADVRAAEAMAAPNRLTDPEMTVGVGPLASPEGAGVAATVGFMQGLEVHGERRLRRERAGAWSAEQEQMLEAARWTVHTNVHAHYTEALAARLQWDVYSELLEFSQGVRDVVSRRVEAGEDARLSLVLADADVAAARQEQMRTRAEYKNALATLAAAVGWTEEGLPIPASELDEIREPPPFESILELARESRPDTMVLARRIQRLEVERDLAAQLSRPDPAIGGEYEFGSIAGSGTEHRALLVFEFGFGTERRRLALTSSAEADIVRANSEAAALEQNIRAEVRVSWQQLVGAHDRLRLYADDVIPRWEENLELVRRAFDEGEIDLMEVLFAEERLLEQQSGAIEATRDYYIALAGLELAVGAEVLQ